MPAEIPAMTRRRAEERSVCRPPWTNLASVQRLARREPLLRSLGLNGGHAREVSFDRPYTDAMARAILLLRGRAGAVDESHGYDGHHPDPTSRASRTFAARRPKLFISSGHDEYWSRGERTPVEARSPAAPAPPSSPRTPVCSGRSVSSLRGPGPSLPHRRSATRSPPSRRSPEGTNLITKRWRDPAVAEPEQKLLA